MAPVFFIARIRINTHQLNTLRSYCIQAQGRKKIIKTHDENFNKQKSFLFFFFLQKLWIRFYFTNNLYKKIILK